MREILVKAEEFKDSPLGKIPKDWEVKTLASITSKIIDGTHFTPTYLENGVPFLRVTDIQSSTIDFDNVKRISLQEHHLLTTRCNPQIGDILYSKNGTVGITKLVDWHQKFSIFVSLCLIRPVTTLVNPLYLAKILQSFLIEQQIRVRSKQMTVINLHLEEIREFLIPLPKLDEQDRIVKILDTIDSAIAHTSSLIAKLKQMKAGLLHDLLTRGLDENGELRDAIAHPEQFKSSPLGQIPKDWDVTHLTKEIDIVHGYAFKGEYFADSPPGEVLLVPGNFHREGGLYFDENNTKYYRGEVPEITVLDNGELLIVMTDLSPRTLILGRVVQLQLPFQVLHNQRIGKIVPKLPDTWDKRFLMLVMNSDRVRRNIISNATGTTVRHTSPDRIMANIIPKPNIKEQSRIVEIFDTYDTRIRVEEAYRDKLKLQKQGLMHDLLTGKVRVNCLGDK